MRGRPLGVAILVAGLVAGCSSAADTAAPSTPSTPVDVLVVEATDSLRFEPAVATVLAGSEVRLELRSGRAVEHDFVIAGAAGHGMVGDGGHGPHRGDHHMDGDGLHVAHATAGMTDVGTFRIDTAGTYEAYCSIPGHRAAGMTMVLHVVPAA
jgi:uncharacterized cupredoxin-like copper-binding protein